MFYSLRSKTYSHRDRRVTEMEFNRKMEIEVQMRADREQEETRRRADEDRVALLAGARKSGPGPGSGTVVGKADKSFGSGTRTNGVVKKPDSLAARMRRRRGVGGGAF